MEIARNNSYPQEHGMRNDLSHTMASYCNNRYHQIVKKKVNEQYKTERGLCASQDVRQ